MKEVLYAALTVCALLSATEHAYANCTGGIASDTLSCSSDSGTLVDYRTWIESAYIPAAVEKAMSRYAASFDPTRFDQGGYSQVVDIWGNGGFSEFTSKYWWPNEEFTITSQKLASQFLIDSLGGNGANIYVDINWIGTSAVTIQSVTSYIASYSYRYTGGAWGAAVYNGQVLWPTQAVFGSGIGGYAFTRNVAPVPGPEAGIGLGYLALGAAMIWLIGRRREANFSKLLSSVWCS